MITKRISRTATFGAVFVIRFYQAYIRPRLIGQCKFYPTCSQYGIDAIESHGLFYGGYLTLRRLLRCHPFAHRGYDPVPPARRNHSANRDSPCSIDTVGS